jgi:hypothetical protein
MNSNTTHITESANLTLASRVYWLFGSTVALAATLLGGFAPLPFLAYSLGLGVASFAMLLLAWRFGSSLLYGLSIGLWSVGSIELGRSFKLELGAWLLQGFLLSLSVIALLLVIANSFIRKFCRLPTPAA